MTVGVRSKLATYWGRLRPGFGGGAWARGWLRLRQESSRRTKRADYARWLDVSYSTAADADAVRHRLDVYAPLGAKGLPTLVFFHGGGWTLGHKSSAMFGLYNLLGATLARLGLVVVMANYRLSPWVSHEAQIADAAAAFAWAQRHIARYGGDPRGLFAGGHSAGGHLAALLATNPRHLGAHGLSLADVCGCVAISAVFRIEPLIKVLATVPLLHYFVALKSVFGSDEQARAQASPVNHVAAGMPPFLVLYAAGDWGVLGDQARAFAAACTEAAAEVQCVPVADRGHLTVMAKARHAGDPVVDAVTAFVARYRRANVG